MMKTRLSVNTMSKSWVC